MLRENPHPLCSPSKALCIVLPDNCDALSDYYTSITKHLIANAWTVHVLTCRADPSRMSAFTTLGAKVVTLDALSLPSECFIKGPNQSQRLLDSEQLRHALSKLCKQEPFSLVEWADRGGLGFRSIQAKRHRLEFQNVPFVVTKFGSSKHQRDAHGQWMDHPIQLAEDFAEGYCCDNADVTEDALLLQASPEDVVQHYERLIELPSLQALASQQQPLVTIGIAYYNLGEFLGETLASIAKQTYDNLEVIIIDDGSTDPHSVDTFHQLKQQYPNFRFFTQPNAGIGATRNRALELARGTYFLPMDADNLARPDMVAKFVTAMQANPDLAAVSCYFLAFRDSPDVRTARFAYAYRPIGGPRLLATLMNVYGDGNALFCTERLRHIGGYSTDRDTSWEDWEVFVKLANAGLAIDVVPEVLFYYRHRESGFSRATNDYRNQQRILRNVAPGQFSDSEQHTLMHLLVSLQRKLDHEANDNRALRTKMTARRYRWADWAHSCVKNLAAMVGL